MADVDEDTPISSLHKQGPNEDNDISDETQDFRFLAALTSKNATIPKRGEKDFEPHGTKHQDAILEASREAMHDALDYTRSHNSKNYTKAWFFGEGLDSHGELTDESRGTGLNEDHIVRVDRPRGPHYRTMGMVGKGKASQDSLWLLPEEALYLVERGNLDLWWPARTSESTAEDVEGDDGVPMSLQAAYALLIGEEGEKGKVTMDRYTVYANLKRTGYVVLRKAEEPISPPEQSWSLFKWLIGAYSVEKPEKPVKHQPYGPLVRPGLYRSYDDIYRQLAVIERHKPSSIPIDLPSQAPFEVVYHIWKPNRIPTFAKSNPGIPDFRSAVVSARDTNVPSMTQMLGLLESTPWDPPNKEWVGPAKSYQRIKHGYRNVVIAVVDQGIISYLRMAEAAFGEEPLYKRFGKAPGRGGKGGPRRGGKR